MITSISDQPLSVKKNLNKLEQFEKGYATSFKFRYSNFVSVLRMLSQSNVTCFFSLFKSGPSGQWSFIISVTLLTYIILHIHSV